MEYNEQNQPIIDHPIVRDKISRVSNLDEESGKKLQDFAGSVTFILNNRNLVSGKIDPNRLEEDANLIARNIISLDINDLIKRLKSISGMNVGTEQNIENIKTILLN